MKTLLALSAILSLAACASTTPGGPRTDWNCDGASAYSARILSNGAAEVFAGGQVYTLAGAGGRYSNGSVTYSDDGALSGAQGGPYTNCRRG